MKIIPVILFISAQILAGCVSIHTIDPSNMEDPSYVRVNKLAAKKQAVIKIRNKPLLRVRSLDVRPDSTSWIGNDGVYETVATTQVQDIRIKGKSVGPVLGAIGTTLLGAVVGRRLGTSKEQTFHPGSYAFKPAGCYDIWGWEFSCWEAETIHNQPWSETRTHISTTAVTLGAAVGLAVGVLLIRRNRGYHYMIQVPSPPSEPPPVSTYYPPHRKAGIVPHRKR